MIVAGVDLGSSTAKAVIFHDDEMFYTINLVQNKWQVEAEKVLEKTMEKAGLLIGRSPQ